MQTALLYNTKMEKFFKPNAEERKTSEKALKGVELEHQLEKEKVITKEIDFGKFTTSESPN